MSFFFQDQSLSDKANSIDTFYLDVAGLFPESFSSDPSVHDAQRTPCPLCLLAEASQHDSLDGATTSSAQDSLTGTESPFQVASWEESETRPNQSSPRSQSGTILLPCGSDKKLLLQFFHVQGDTHIIYRHLTFEQIRMYGSGPVEDPKSWHFMPFRMVPWGTPSDGSTTGGKAVSGEASSKKSTGGEASGVERPKGYHHETVRPYVKWTSIDEATLATAGIIVKPGLRGKENPKSENWIDLNIGNPKVPPFILRKGHDLRP